MKEPSPLFIKKNIYLYCMEVNNFNAIKEFAKNEGYDKYPVFLQFIVRKEDHPGSIIFDTRNSIREKEIFAKNIFSLEEDYIVNLCKKYGARCYLRFIDDYIIQFLNISKKTIKDFHYELFTTMQDTKGYHLIDVDNLDLEDDCLNWIYDNVYHKHSHNIYTFNTITGKSILFFSSVKDCIKYGKTDLNEENGMHISYNLLLYAPNFKECEENYKEYENSRKDSRIYHNEEIDFIV